MIRFRRVSIGHGSWYGPCDPASSGRADGQDGRAGASSRRRPHGASRPGRGVVRDCGRGAISRARGRPGAAGAGDRGTVARDFNRTVPGKDWTKDGLFGEARGEAAKAEFGYEFKFPLTDWPIECGEFWHAANS